MASRLKDLIREGQFAEAYRSLDEKRLHYKLNSIEFIAYKLTQKYLSISESKKAPEVVYCRQNYNGDLLLMITYNDFKAVRDNALQFCQERGFNTSEHITYILANAICDLIDSINASVDNKITDLLLKEKYQELMDKKTLVMIDGLSAFDANRYFGMIERLPKTKASIIPYNGSFIIIMRYFEPETSIDPIKLAQDSRAQFANHDYSAVIESNNLLLAHYYNVKAVTYNRLGSAHYYLGHKREAFISWLAATYISQTYELGDIDRSKYLSELEKDLRKEEELELFDFMDDNNFFGVKNAKEIMGYIDINGLDVFTACNILGINKIDMLKIQLLYARKFYAAGMFVGDRFISFVEDYLIRCERIPEEISHLLRLAKKSRVVYAKNDIKALEGASINLRPIKNQSE